MKRDFFKACSLLVFGILMRFMGYEDYDTIQFILQMTTEMFLFLLFFLLPQVQSAAAGSAASESHQPHERGCGKGCCVCSILSPLQTGTQSGMRWGSAKLQHVIMEFCV